MGENSNSKGTALAKLAASIVLAGGLVAGLALPYVGGVALATRSSADLVNGLPDQLTVNIPAGNSRVLAADGSLITEFYTHNRTPVPSGNIAPIMKQAQVDIEDSRFYQHGGVDLQGTARALVTNLAAGSVQEGGSTLTQQLVKQTLLQTATTAQERQAAVQQSLGRKLREAKLAMALNEKYSKDEILTRYLNTVYFGEGAYGIEAAAQTYFGTHASDLTLPQAALLAGLVQSPSGDDPVNHPQNATTRRNEVLKRMRELGHITDQQYAQAVATPVQVQQGQPAPNGCQNAVVGGFFCAYLQDYLVNTLKISQDELDNGGLTIQTTLRPDIQRSGDQGVLNHVPMGDRFAGILTAVQPGTGHVLAMSDNRQYGCPKSQGPQCESVNLNVVASAGSGSTYKVFTAAAALSQGFGAHYTITAPQPYTSHVYKTWDSNLRKLVPYTISNDDANYKATYDMTSALVASANTYYVALEDALGSIEGPVRAAQAMGLHSLDPIAQRIIDQQQGSFTLGPFPTSPLYLASAYSTLAANGTQCDPTPVIKILDHNGQPLKDATGKVIDTGDHCKPNVIAPGVADTLNQMMLGVVSPAGTGRKAVIPGHDIAGKTGTINSNNSATFVGSTPNYTVSVMYFNPKKQESVGDVGGGVPAQIYHDAMAPILTGEPNVSFPAADPAVVAGNGQNADSPGADSFGNIPNVAPAPAPGPDLTAVGGPPHP